MKKTLLALTLAALTLGAAVSCQNDDINEPVNLVSGESANCYIISAEGTYYFPAVKGNSAESVGVVSSVDVLWEASRSTTEPKAGEMIANLRYEDGKIVFSASAHKGNAVIAARDEAGTILWSWHIWMTDKPAEQVYNNGAGTMMDRNLGATSATPDDPGSFGLMYQWGRKDPFCGVAELASGKSTKLSTKAQWPEAVVSDANTGTIEYTLSHPMTFIKHNDNNYDWYYKDDETTDDTRWQSEKTIYDPCPAGWRVPDGGPDGIWAKAFGTTKDYIQSESGFDTGESGVDFSKTEPALASCETIWYPFEGVIYSDSGVLSNILEMGGCWSVATRNIYGYVFAATKPDKCIIPAIDSTRPNGCSLRCMKEM